MLDDVLNEKAKLVKATFGSKLGKKITSDILMPILDQLEDDIPTIMEEAAQWARDKIANLLVAASPSGRTYKIYEYDPDAPYGQRTTLLREYTASAPGQPPARLTGTLSEAIDYEMFMDGSFRVGFFKKFGDYSDLETEFESVFYRGGKIFVNPDLEKSVKTPVGSYAQYLKEGTENMSARPWFSNFMNSIREELRKRIRTEIRKSLNTSTRRISVRHAIVFKVYFT